MRKLPCAPRRRSELRGLVPRLSRGGRKDRDLPSTGRGAGALRGVSSAAPFLAEGSPRDADPVSSLPRRAEAEAARGERVWGLPRRASLRARREGPRVLRGVPRGRETDRGSRGVRRLSRSGGPLPGVADGGLRELSRGHASESQRRSLEVRGLPRAPRRRGGEDLRKLSRGRSPRRGPRGRGAGVRKVPRPPRRGAQTHGVGLRDVPRGAGASPSYPRRARDLRRLP